MVSKCCSIHTYNERGVAKLSSGFGKRVCKDVVQKSYIREKDGSGYLKRSTLENDLYPNYTSYLCQKIHFNPDLKLL